MTTLTHLPPGARLAPYAGRGPFTGTPTAPAGCVRVVADAPRRWLDSRCSGGWSPSCTGSYRPYPAPTSCRRPAGHQFDLVPYVGVHQPNEQARRCRTCPMNTTWPHGYCSRCTDLGKDPGCRRCRPLDPASSVDGQS